MPDDLKTRGLNLALGTWRDAALHDFKEARRHVEAAIQATQAGGPSTAAHEGARAAERASAGTSAAVGWKGAAEVARLLDDDGAPGGARTLFDQLVRLRGRTDLSRAETVAVSAVLDLIDRIIRNEITRMEAGK